MFTKILGNQQGISLLETMLAAAISIVVAMGVMQINQNANKGMARIEAKADLVDFKSNIQRKLLSYSGSPAVSNCRPAFDNLFGNELSKSTATVRNTAGDTFSIGGSNELIVGEMIPEAPGINVVALRYGPFVQNGNSNQGRCDLEMELTNARDGQQGTFFKTIPIQCTVDDGALDPVTLGSCSVSADVQETGLGQLVQDSANRDIMQFNDSPWAVIGGNPEIDLNNVRAGLTIGTNSTDHPSLVSNSLAVDLESGASITWGSSEGGDTAGIWGDDNGLFFEGSNFSANNLIIDIGRADMGSSLNIRGGAINIDGTIMNTGTTNSGSVTINDPDGLSVTGPSGFTGNMNVTGSGVFSGPVSGSTLTSYGDATLFANATIHGNADMRNNANVATSLNVGSVLTVSTVYAGDIFANSVTTSSDERFKKEIELLSHVSEKLEDIRGVTYFLRHDEFPEKKFSDKKQIGLIAQEVERVFPELVYTNENGYKSVAYSNFVAILLEAVKEQKQEILDNKAKSNTQALKTNQKLEELSGELKTLKGENKLLREELRKIKALLEIE